MAESIFFETERVTERITRIRGICGELTYLAEGDEKAALIDTGVGLGNLRGLVESLTKKPVTVILTHGHVDHAMGASAFDEVYLNPADENIFRRHSDFAVRKGFVRSNVKNYDAVVHDSDYVPSKEIAFHPLLEGDVFPLGGMTLRIYSAKGHTPGCVVVLFEEERILLLGDACNSFTFLFDENSSSVEEYKIMLESLLKKVQGKYDRVLFSHGPGEDGKEMIESVIRVCDDVLAGKADDVPFRFMNETASIAKKINGRMQRADGGLGNIIYNKNNVFQRK